MQQSFFRHMTHRSSGGIDGQSNGLPVVPSVVVPPPVAVPSSVVSIHPVVSVELDDSGAVVRSDAVVVSVAWFDVVSLMVTSVGALLSVSSAVGELAAALAEGGALSVDVSLVLSGPPASVAGSVLTSGLKKHAEATGPANMPHNFASVHLGIHSKYSGRPENTSEVRRFGIFKSALFSRRTARNRALSPTAKRATLVLPG